MPARAWIAILLLINYLLVVGTGCVSNSENQRGFVMVQTSQSGQDYQECRYLRLDGLENFLAEALATQYQETPATPKHHLISIVLGVDAHYLTVVTWLLPVVNALRTTARAAGYQPPVPAEVSTSISAPPWRQ